MQKIKKKMRIHDLHPVKSFGQNFLFDDNILNKITACVDLTGANVIEIGTGLAHLTKKLAASAKKVITFEIDRKLITFLATELQQIEGIKVINSDFLKVDLMTLAKNEFNNESIVVVANLPYYLTSKIMFHLIKNYCLFNDFVLMMQKEVADRFTAKPNTKQYNNLSIMLQYYCSIKKMFIVKPQSFYPAPKVVSAVVHFQIKKNIAFKPEQFWDFIRACFQQKRKTLVNNLAYYLNNKTSAINIIKKLGWKENIRAESLTLIMFEDLYELIDK